MRKKIYILAVVLLGIFLAGGCSVRKAGAEKIRDLEYTVLEETEIPETLRNEIEQRENGNGPVFYDNGRKRMKQLQFLQRMLMLSVLVLRRVRMHDRNTVHNMNVCKRDDFSQIQDKDNRENPAEICLQSCFQ